MLKIEKKQVKMVSVAIAALFLLGIVGVALSQSSTSHAAASSNIGVVDFQALVNQHPDMAQAEEAFKGEYEQAKKDFESKAPSMSDKERQDYNTQLQQRLNMKRQELMGAIVDKVNANVKTVAEAKGLAVVVDKSAVVYGGTDITSDVLKKITGK